MKKFEVFFEQAEHFVVDVKAKTRKEAIEKAMEKFDEGNYDECGDYSVDVSKCKRIKG